MDTITLSQNFVSGTLSLEQILSLALENVQQDLTQFASNPEFIDKMRLVYGESFDPQVAQNLAQTWLNEDFNSIPPIEILTGSQLNGAYGAYAPAINQIYLSQEFFSQNQGNIGALASVLLEEYGHSVDGILNSTDAPGDEGELFSGLVRGVNLSQSELTRMQTEDDHGFIALQGELIQVEQSTPIILTVNTTIDENDGSATIGMGLSLRDAVTIANQNYNTPYVIKLISGTTYELTYVNNATTGDRSLNTYGNITIECDGGLPASIVNNSSPIPDKTGWNYIIYNTYLLTLNNISISNKAGVGIYNYSSWKSPTLNINNSSIINNNYYGIANFYGSLNINNSSIKNNTYSGIYNDGTSNLTNNTITGNSNSFNDGGGIVNWGTATLTNNTITGNTANRYGGGIVNWGTATLTSNTITGNTITSNSIESSGGGIANIGKATLTDNYITDNTANYGSGIENLGTATLTNNTITGNNGGGIENSHTATANLTNNTITDNNGYGVVIGDTATANLTNNTITGNNGNGVVISGTANLTNNTITGNTAYQSGGGVFININGKATLTNNIITGNTADSGGGGISNIGTATLTNNIITDNTGGGISNEGKATLTNNIITGNTANWGGGGIVNGGTATLTNNIITGNTVNSSFYGGGGIVNGGTAILTNNTITGNAANLGGGGIQNMYYGTATLTNNTITGNTANYGGGIYNQGTWSSNSTITGNTSSSVWYIDKNGNVTTVQYYYDPYPYLRENPIHPKYPNIYDEGTFTALPPSPDPPPDPPTPEPTISVSNAWVDRSAGISAYRTLKFNVKLSSAYDKPITVDYHTIDGTATSLGSNSSKDFQGVSKNTLVFFPGETSKQIEINVFGSGPVTDETLELFARDTAYRQWTNADLNKEIDKIYNYDDPGYEGYYINKIFTNTTTGFNAVGLTSDEKFSLVLDNPINASISQASATGTIYNETKPPILAIRGTEPNSLLDILSDTNSQGIGYNQFIGNQTEINQWLSQVSHPETDLTLRPDITGHSLGGALTQWVVASYQGYLGHIATFNSPGISQQPGINLNASNNLGVTHYITSGDVISMGGLTYLDGFWRLSKYSKLTSAITLEKHSVPVLNGEILKTNYKKPADLQMFDPRGTSDLNSYWFTYLPDADYFKLQLAVAGLGTIVGFSRKGADIAADLTFRGTVEHDRQAIGTAIKSLGTISDAVTSAWNAAKSWVQNAWDAIIEESKEMLGLSSSTQTFSIQSIDSNSSIQDVNINQSLTQPLDQTTTITTTTDLIDNFWSAVPYWSDNAWQATTTWSDEAWNSINEWTPQTWQATTTWTATDWNTPFFTISNPTITEGNTGTKDIVFTVTLSTTSDQTITVDYSTADGTAKAQIDYIAKTGTLTFTPGQTSQDIIISVNGDTVVESDETFLINLSNPNNAIITDNQGLGTITNDDLNHAPILNQAIPDKTIKEGDPFTFEIPLNTFTDSDGETLKYSLAEGTILPEGINFDSVTGKFLGTPTFTSAGIYNITIIATDAAGASASDSFKLNVTNVIIEDDGNNTLVGGDGDDFIDAKDGRDNITGGKGNDTIIGGTGADILAGGEGADSFVYNNIRDRGDQITDFNVNEDRLDFSALLDSFNYLGSNPIGEGYVSWSKLGNDTMISVDTDGIFGRGRPTPYILLLGINSNTLTANNFVF